MATTYRDAIRHKDHDYGEYIKEINFLDVAKESIEDQRIYNRTKEFLIEEYEDRLTGARKRRKIKQKAKQAVHPRLNGPQNFIPKFKGRAGTEQLIKDAIEEGYLRNIKLNVPWHPAIYEDENKLTTFPHQHKAAVVYSGRSMDELYSRKYLKKNEVHKNKDRSIQGNGLESVDELYNAKSILKRGFIAPGGGNHGVNSKEEEGREFEARFGVFLSADNYFMVRSDSGFTIEVESPTNLLGFKDRDSPKEVIWSIQDWFETYNSPKADFGREEIVFAKKYGERGEPYLPLKFVNGVHSDEFSTGVAHFYPLKQFAKGIYEKYPDRIPEPSEWNLQEADRDALDYTFKRKSKAKGINTEVLENERKKIKVLRKCLERLEENTEAIIRNIQNENIGSLLDMILYYNDNLSMINTKYNIESREVSLGKLLKRGYLSATLERIEGHREEAVQMEKLAMQISETNNTEKLSKLKEKRKEMTANLEKNLVFIRTDKTLVNTIVETINPEKQEKQRLREQVAEKLKQKKD